MTAEIRGRDERWSLWYENEEWQTHPVGVYRDGELVKTIYPSGGESFMKSERDSERFVQAHLPILDSQYTGPRMYGAFEECDTHAHFLGASEIRVIQTAPFRRPKQEATDVAKLHKFVSDFSGKEIEDAKKAVSVVLKFADGKVVQADAHILDPLIAEVEKVGRAVARRGRKPAEVGPQK